MKKLHTFIYSLFIGCLIASPFLQADDTDIYVGANVTKGKSNILLSLDTSGSMIAHAINFNAVTQGLTSESLPNHPKYDPNRSYDGSRGLADTAGCFDNAAYVTRTSFGSPRVPYVAYRSNTQDISNPAGVPYYTCDRDVDSTYTINDAGLYLSNGDRYSQAILINAAGCAAATTALNTVGYFIDTNNVCTGDRFNRMNFSGRFLDFINSLTNANGYPIDTNGNAVPWSNFFVESRLQVVKDVVNDIINNNDDFDINIGMMRFNGGSGGYVLEPTKPLLNADGTKNTTNQISLRNDLNNLAASGSTPLEENYFESSLYFRGLDDVYGANSDSAAFSGGFYKSPITHACQKNSVILLTDGDPTSDSDAEARILTLWNANKDQLDKSGDSIAITTDDSVCLANGTNNGACMDELAQYMDEIDLFSDVGLIGPDGDVLTSDLGIPQTVTTHTVGFFNDNQLLANTAKAGNGISRLATNSDDLKAFFRDAIESVVEEASSFTAPSISVNSLNRLENLDDLYFSLFQPANSPLWSGNIKKYKLTNQVITDSTGVPAIDNSISKFRDNARSFWTHTPLPDGNETTEGGFANRLTVTRNVYSNLTGGSLSATANEVNATNISPTQFGLAATDTTTAQSYVDWMNGIKLDADGAVVSTNFIGDTLHTTPIVLTYGAAGPNADQALFFGTNAGFLHGIDVTPASPTANMEHFAFFPKELLGRVPEYVNNQPTGGVFSKIYGMDGPLSSWIRNDNGNGVIESGETPYIFATMRRGGDGIYALNVTNYTNPILAWSANASTPGFEELGQSWSKVIPTKINYGGTSKNVVIFGGGYDTNQDSATTRSVDSKGRAIYIVEADGANAGNILWRAIGPNSASTGSMDTLTLPDMQYSIPSDLGVIDSNGDGYADKIYTGDMGGQLWRFDILDQPIGGQNITGGVIADLSTNNLANSRRFFSAPSVARVSNDAFGNYLAVAIGSGKRPDPKSTYTNDKFYMIKDYYVSGPRIENNNASYDYVALSATNYTKITDNGTLIADITNNGNPTVDEIGEFGWMIDFATSGEKVLTPALTADNLIVFNTYIPNATPNTFDLCDVTASIGSSRVYQVSLFDGRAGAYIGKTDAEIEAIENNSPDQINDARFGDLADGGGGATIPGIAPPPQLVVTSEDTNTSTCTSSSTATLVVGTRAINPRICTAPVRTYWNRFDN